jgi:DNA-binding CsgD family transcriptional regulator/PAS domain-containing protein
VVTMIAKLTRSNFACLYYKNKEVGFANTVAQYGLPADQQIDFGEKLDTLDEMIGAGIKVEPDEPQFTHFHPGSNGVMSSDCELYQNWMEPNDVYYVGGTQFADTGTHKAGIVILRSKDAGVWSDGEIRVINEILPHLNRSLKIHSEFTHLRMRQDALLQGLDRLVIGLILYNHDARTVYINPTAEAIIDSHPALQLEQGNLLLTNPDDDKSLRQTIVETAAIDPDDSWKQSVAIGITHPDVEAPLPILVTPMHAHLITSDLDYEGAKVAVFLSDPNLQQPISIDSLVSVYSLTPSEAQVAISLANGHSIDQIATNSNHSAHTIRSQLKSVFRKTGVSRQSELIKLLLTGPFAQRRRSAAP